MGLFRILQEALTNVVRHAGASQVRVSLSVAAGTIGVRSGTQMAASDGLTVRLLGRGGRAGGDGEQAHQQREQGHQA